MTPTKKKNTASLIWREPFKSGYPVPPSHCTACQRAEQSLSPGETKQFLSSLHSTEAFNRNAFPSDTHTRERNCGFYRPPSWHVLLFRLSANTLCSPSRRVWRYVQSYAFQMRWTKAPQMSASEANASYAATTALTGHSNPVYFTGILSGGVERKLKLKRALDVGGIFPSGQDDRGLLQLVCLLELTDAATFWQSLS